MNSHQRRVARRARSVPVNRYLANIAPFTPAVGKVWSRLLEEQCGQFIFSVNQFMDEMRIDIRGEINQQIAKYASTHSCKQCGEPLYQHAYGIDVDNHQYSIVFRCTRKPMS